MSTATVPTTAVQCMNSDVYATSDMVGAPGGTARRAVPVPNARKTTANLAAILQVQVESFSSNKNIHFWA